MKYFLLITSSVIFSLSAYAQQSSFQDTLLDHLAGKWVLHGIIDGMETTHDIDAEWVLAHQYLQIHEISREKDSSGAAAYEAIVYFGWDEPTDQYACLWLDITGGGGLTGEAIGHAGREKDRIALIFKAPDGSLFHTTFLHDGKNGQWQWLMDAESNGKLIPFARLKLTRK